MAVIFPDPCPSKATAGERRVHALLRNHLPGEFTAWYEPDVRGRQPDFTVLSPTFGLLILEVKGWHAGHIARADGHEFVLERVEGGTKRVESHKNPLRQAREYMFRMVGELGRPEFVILHQADGEHRGKLRFPCGYGVVLTSITRAQFDNARLTAVLPAEKVLCKDELETLATSPETDLVSRLRAMFEVSFPFEPLTEDQWKTIKGVLHPEVVVRKRPARAGSVRDDQPLLPGAVSLEVLDAEQEQMARSLGDGHRIIFGVAGSGKTVLLLARLRFLLGRAPGLRVLVLCYNKALAAYLAEQVGADPLLRGAVVRHFHSWAARWAASSKELDESFDDYEARLVRTILQAAPHVSEAEKYDAILIDEAHDFEPDWLRCVTGLLRGGPQGELLIAVDGAQSLYGRPRAFTWKSVGVEASGRTRQLSRNYRNTKQIVEFAWQVTQAALADEAPSETHVRVLPTKARRTGQSPSYRGCASVNEEHAFIARQIAEFRAQGLLESEIAVLYPRREGNRIDALCRRLREHVAVSWVSNENDPAGGVRSLARPGVRLMTIHAAKGLEFPAAIVTAVDQLPSPFDPDERRDANLLYVGLTRALEHLVVTWAGRSAFTERIERSPRAARIAELAAPSR
jgi:hypothetical protein